MIYAIRRSPCVASPMDIVSEVSMASAKTVAPRMVSVAFDFEQAPACLAHEGLDFAPIITNNVFDEAVDLITTQDIEHI